MKMIFSDNLWSTEKVPWYRLSIQEIEVKDYNSFIPYQAPMLSHFYKLVEAKERIFSKMGREHVILRSSIYLDNQYESITRTSYDINMFMSDIGGVMRVIMTMIGLFIHPF